MEVSKELRNDIERNQNQLKIAIKNHQNLVIKSKADPENVDIKLKIKAAQNDIISVGLDQKELIERLKCELKIHQKTIKENVTKTGLDDRRSNLSSILNKAKKQNLTIRSTSVSSASTSEDSLDIPSAPSSPNPPLYPHELTQADFLGRVGLCTHDTYKELQNKRVERKRRSTANPHFLYGNSRFKWDQVKRKKNSYLLTLSPPNTRQAVKNKQKAEQRLSPTRSDSRSSSPGKATVPTGFPNIPNLPSGLTIERITINSSTSPTDNNTVTLCVICRQPGLLSVCDTCSNQFHIGCHNRPLISQPRQCPKCLSKKDVIGLSRDVGSLNVPPSMTVLATYVSAQVQEKTEDRKILEEKNKQLNEELMKLEERASELTISLQTQDEEKKELLDRQLVTKEKIQRLLDFVNLMKGSPASSPGPPTIKANDDS